MSYNKCGDCKNEYPIYDECLTCYNYSNFEPKEKPMSEIKLTEENARRILGNVILEYDFFRNDFLNKRGSVNYDEFKNVMIEKWGKDGWIVKDEVEQAIEDVKNYIKQYKDTCANNIAKDIVIDKCMKVIDLLQKRIKELEAK